MPSRALSLDRAKLFMVQSRVPMPSSVLILNREERSMEQCRVAMPSRVPIRSRMALYMVRSARSLLR